MIDKTKEAAPSDNSDVSRVGGPDDSRLSTTDARVGGPDDSRSLATQDQTRSATESES